MAGAPKGWLDVCDGRQKICRGFLYEISGLPVLCLLDKSHKVPLKNIPQWKLRTFLWANNAFFDIFLS